MRDLYRLSIAEAENGIRTRKFSPSDLVKSLLDRINDIEPKVHAFVSVERDKVLELAEVANREASEGRFRGPLHGIPIGIKDVIDTEGMRTTSGSKLRQNYIPTHDAEVVRKLKNAGALVLGKTVTHEWAFEVFCPPTRNPWDIAHIAGGSSGGSAAAVAADMCPGAVGSDGGGSLRIPSSLCGIVGLKPTFGLVSTLGTTPGDWTVSHIGPMTRTVEDAALLLNAMAGDGSHSKSTSNGVKDYALSLRNGIKGMRVGVPSNYFFELINPEVAERVKFAIDLIGEKGASLKDVFMQHVEYAPSALAAIGLAEPADYHEKGIRAHPESYGQDVRTEFQIGALIPSKYYVKAQRFRSYFKAALDRLFDLVDVILTPTVPAPASLVEQRTFNFQGVEEDVSNTFSRFCLPFNLSGTPAITIPCGFAEKRLPVGLQITGRAYEEEKVLRVAHSIETAIGWTKYYPPL